MRISSNLLLIMVVGVLQFPNLESARGSEHSFRKMTKVRKSANNELLYKFAQQYLAVQKRDPILKFNTLKIDFPTAENQKDWGEHFERKSDGTFVYRLEFDRLLREVHQLQRFRLLNNIREALNRALMA